MGEISVKLMNNSLAAALSAIEIYNKPDFKYREEVFTILVINAWELLMKAKIVEDADDDVSSLYVVSGGAPKLNRSGTPMTIEIVKAMKVVGLDDIVQENLLALIDVRDTAVHLYHNEALGYLVFTLGVAALKNYQRVIREWFGKSLLEYNFYILPIGFAYSFKTLSMLELEKGPEPISNLVRCVATYQTSMNEPNNYDLVCEVAIELRAARHFPSGADLSAAIDAEAEGTIIVNRTVQLIDRYPLSYMELCKKVLRARQSVKQTAINKVIRDHNLKGDLRFSAYNFRTRLQREEYERTRALPLGITSIYNEDAVRFITEHVEG